MLDHLKILLFGSLVFLLTSACTLGSGGDRPAVEIQSPADGTTVAVNAPVIISSIAADPNGPGVANIELFVDGESLQVDESPTGPQKVFDVAQIWTPDVEGRYELTIIAYREDETPSRPDTVEVEVVGLTLDPDQTPTVVRPATEAATTEEASPQDAIDVVYVQAEVLVLANLRQGPGPICDIVGSISAGETINVIEYSGDGLWLKTDALPGERTAWIFNGSLRFLDPPEAIPQGTQFGCAGCGDNACNLDETCDSCPEDCGQCCGNNVCDTQFGEDCGTCEGDCGACCGNGTCEPDRGEDCASCSTDCGQCCGNGLCEADRGETCSTCSSDCGNCCGNGLCEADLNEDCETCETDCGVCEPVETETATSTPDDDDDGETETPDPEETETETATEPPDPSEEPSQEPSEEPSEEPAEPDPSPSPSEEAT